MKPSRKLIFVTPWYGKYATGGAETLCKSVVEHLHNSGHKVEVFTTTSKQFQSEWKNDFSPGECVENGIVVKRFKVDSRDPDLFNSLNQKILSSTPLTEEQELDFFKNNINSKEMMNTIKNDSENLFVFIPYLYGTTFFGCQIHPNRSVMIPCLHDEGYSRMSLMKKAMLQVKALSFNSQAEKELATKLLDNLPHNAVIGSGIDNTTQSDPERFKKKYGLNKFILYAGRKANEKNVPLLIEYFEKFLERNNTDLKLVLTGSGKANIPSKFSKNILDLFLPKEELYDAYSAATLFCMPSVNESFSIVIMESWLNNTPVLVNNKCAVTKECCLESNGGLYFDNFLEFEECIKFFLNNPDIGKKLGENGKNYVLANYNWDKITKSYADFLNSI